MQNHLRTRSLAVALAALATASSAASAQNVSVPSVRGVYTGELFSTIVTQGNATNTAPSAPGNPDNDRFLATNARGFSGVVSLRIVTPQGVFGCSGSLINATQVLTAAHCITNGSNAITASSVDVRFWNSSNQIVASDTRTALTSALRVHPNYTGLVVADNDVAIINLPSAAPSYASIVSIYGGTSASALGSQVTFVGFGTTGTGTTGDNQGGYAFARRYGFNRLDASCNAIGTTQADNDCEFTGQLVTGTGPDATGSVWNTDFDNGTYAANSLGQIYGCSSTRVGGICNTGTTNDILDEVGIGRGDSGGPMLVNGQIVGVASWGTTGSSNLQFNNRFGSWGAFYGHTNILSASNRAFISAQTTVPEPGTYALMVSGLAGLGVIARRRRQQVSA